MDILERLLGVSPDGGSGATELLYLLVISVVVLAVVFRGAVAHAVTRAVLALRRLIQQRP